MLVWLAAMLAVKVGQVLIIDAQEPLSAESLRTDPGGIIDATGAGISFLGASIIFRDPWPSVLVGLTTAASILTVVPIGVAVAIERYVPATGATLLVLFVLSVMRRMEVATSTPRNKLPLDE